MLKIAGLCEQQDLLLCLLFCHSNKFTPPPSGPGPFLASL